ncbi:hypothetical protein OG21DRAFT_1017232 [Imleria badia]|nr:hypothetical protein OG21DRAFT_1017232 [Imleria badia]
MFYMGSVYLVIVSPAQPVDAIGNLRRDNPTLVDCLQVMVSELGAWDDHDVERNLRGGKLTRDINNLSPEFRAIQDALEQPRVYRFLDRNSANGVLRRMLDLAQIYGSQFERIFRGSWYETPTVTGDQEFVALFNLLRCVAPAMPAIVDRESSSSLKVSHFNVYFMQPPFWLPGILDDSRGFKYRQEQSWRFPMFLETTVQPHTWGKFTPRNDCMVVSPHHGIPFIISEVISDVNESDRRRVLVEAIALARTGQFLLKSSSKKRFFVVALYVDANMVVSRYIVMQTGDVNAGRKPVSIHQKDFDFREVNEQADFLRDMYNLTTQITSLSGDLDQDKSDSLHFVLATTSKLPSLSAMRTKTKASGAHMDTIAEGSAGAHGPQDEDNVFEAEDIQNVLHRMDYEIESIPWGVRALDFSGLRTNAYASILNLL